MTFAVGIRTQVFVVICTCHDCRFCCSSIVIGYLCVVLLCWQVLLFLRDFLLQLQQAKTGKNNFCATLNKQMQFTSSMELSGRLQYLTLATFCRKKAPIGGSAFHDLALQKRLTLLLTIKLKEGKKGISFKLLMYFNG